MSAKSTVANESLTIAGWLERYSCAYVEDTNWSWCPIHSLGFPQSRPDPRRDHYPGDCCHDELVELYHRCIQDESPRYLRHRRRWTQTLRPCWLRVLRYYVRPVLDFRSWLRYAGYFNSFERSFIARRLHSYLCRCCCYCWIRSGQYSNPRKDFLARLDWYCQHSQFE